MVTRRVSEECPSLSRRVSMTPFPPENCSAERSPQDGGRETEWRDQVSAPVDNTAGAEGPDGVGCGGRCEALYRGAAGGRWIVP